MTHKKRNFQYDLEKYYIGMGGSIKPNIIRKIIIWINSFEIHCIIALRINQTLYKKRINSKNRLFRFIFRVIIRILWKQSEFLHHVYINPEMEIGPGFVIMHASSMYIGAKKIGKNCTLFQNTTIGGGAKRHDEGQPKPEIGDNVWIGPNSIITGDIKIGNNVTISAGTVLSKDVPDNCLVGGNPGRIIIQDYHKEVESPIAYQNNEISDSSNY